MKMFDKTKVPQVNLEDVTLEFDETIEEVQNDDLKTYSSEDDEPQHVGMGTNMGAH